MDPSTDPYPSKIREGSIDLHIVPAGKDRGPAVRKSVFYNPAMRMNRDLSVLWLQALAGDGLLPGKGEIRLLDGLSGIGIRSMRFAKEIDWGDLEVSFHACDRDRKAVESGITMAEQNDLDISFHGENLKIHLEENRYSYIDIDPFGSPLSFFVHALDSIINRGYIAITATDTAALCGSAPSVSRRRYGVEMIKTEYNKEVSCRVLMGSFARTAASLDIAIEPILFYASDHFVRGLVRATRGVRRAEKALENMGNFRYEPPKMPEPHSKAGRCLGPVWLGPLEDPDIVGSMTRYLEKEDGVSRWMSRENTVRKLLCNTLSEHSMPPFGYDADRIASHLRTSPPSSSNLISLLANAGIPASRSRFGDKIIRTEATFAAFSRLFEGGG